MKARILLLLATLCLLFPFHASGTDVPIFPTGPVYKITPALTFGSSAPGGFNANFFFTPINVNESICVFFRAANLANVHTFSVAITTTPDPAETTPSDAFWVPATQSVLSSGTGYAIVGLGTNVSGAAQVSLNLSNSVAPADTVQVVIVQSPGPCLTGTNFVNNTLQNVNSVPMLQAVSDGLSQGFFIGTTATNPGNAAQIIDLFDTNALKSVFPDRLLIYASVATTININRVTASGTCTSITANIVNLKIANISTPVATSDSTCSVQPTIISLILAIPIPANTIIVIDLRGFVLPPNPSGPSAINVNMGAALTGTISANLFWAER
jgi:hypothetical protein